MSSVNKFYTMEDKLMNLNTPALCLEVEIPVPWGHISAKTWNDPCGLPILAVHGLQDNAGTFDRLIPLLPTSYYYVCVDLPGHGRSSHFPPGIPLDFFNYVTSIKRVVDHLKWTQFIYLGHSLGGQVGAFFTAMFPENVSKLIMIDVITPQVVPKHLIFKRHRMLHESLVDLEKKVSIRKPPSYTFEEASSRMMDTRNTQLTREAAMALINRSLMQNNDGYCFTTDQRLKNGLRPLLCLDQHMEVVAKIVCPHLIILAQETVGLFFSDDFKQIMDAYQLKSSFTYVVVDGNHDVHNNQPDHVAPVIVNFLNALKSSL